MKKITKKEAIEICRQSLKNPFLNAIKNWDENEITDNPPAGCHIAQRYHETDDFWFVPCPPLGSHPTMKPGSPVIGVSKKTGEIVFSGIVGK